MEPAAIRGRRFYLVRTLGTSPRAWPTGGASPQDCNLRLARLLLRLARHRDDGDRNQHPDPGRCRRPRVGPHGQLLDKDFETPANERILVQSATLTISLPSSRRRSTTSPRRWSPAGGDGAHVTGPGPRPDFSDDHSVLIDFKMRAIPTRPRTACSRSSTRRLHSRPSTPSSRSRNSAPRPCQKQLGRRLHGRLKKAGELSLPVTSGSC